MLEAISWSLVGGQQTVPVVRSRFESVPRRNLVYDNCCWREATRYPISCPCPHPGTQKAFKVEIMVDVIVHTWDSHFLRDDKASDLSDYPRFSLFRKEPLRREVILAGCLEWAVEKANEIVSNG